MNVDTFEQLARWGRPRSSGPWVGEGRRRQCSPRPGAGQTTTRQSALPPRAGDVRFAPPTRPAALRVAVESRWAPHSYDDPETNDQQRPHPLRGFWALLAGGLAIVTVIVVLDPVTGVVLDPVTRQEDCSNYHAGGNASAFDDPVRDLDLAAMGLGWITLTTLEQFLPATHRGGSGWIGAVTRATIAIGLSVAGGCCLIGRLVIMCH